MFFVASVGWEVIEMYIPLEIARETLDNKLMDFVVNTVGFYFGLHLRPKKNGLQ